MSYPKDELPAPEAAHEDSQAFELLRLWFAEGAPQSSARMELWSDPAAWGFMLGEVARHIAVRYASASDVEPAAVLERIRAGFVGELESHGTHGEMDEVPWGQRAGSSLE